MSVPVGIENLELQEMNTASVFVFELIRSTKILPRTSSRFTTMIFLAPARASSTPTARAAPPAPNITTVLPAGSITPSSDFKKPLPSVFSPIYLPSLSTAQLTAPITEADSPIPSRCSITANLFGIEQLNPIQPIAFAPATTSPNFSGPTSIFM